MSSATKQLKKNTLQSRVNARFQLECLQAVVRKRVQTDRADHCDAIARLCATCAAREDGRGLWNNIKKLNSSFKPKGLVGVKLEDGSSARDEQDALQLWVRHFQTLCSAVVTQDPASVTHNPEVHPSAHQAIKCPRLSLRYYRRKSRNTLVNGSNRSNSAPSTCGEQSWPVFWFVPSSPENGGWVTRTCCSSWTLQLRLILPYARNS